VAVSGCAAKEAGAQLNIEEGTESDAAVVANPRKRLLFTRRLREAIEREELSLYYQPQFRSGDGRPCGVEALARWFPPNHRPIPPITFIRRAEQAGLISALGQWVLREACRTAMTWRLPQEEPPIICVNVSPHQIGPEFSRIMIQTLERTGLPPSRLELEITEGVLIENPHLALRWLAQWRHIGVRIALDDFGTGYSSLSYLSRLPVDRVKIDRSLIQRVVTDLKTAAIVRAVISLGADLGFAVLAEGVETEAQFERLLSMGCEQMQGYLLAQPVSADAAATLLTQLWGARRATGRVRVDNSRVSAHAN
jgi:EAL domain-containing protein (putative c-di-GMP-specific phosphodiesterase class I)